MAEIEELLGSLRAGDMNLVDQFLLPSSSGPPGPLPPHRIPNAKQIQGMLSASKQRTRLAVNPFLATWLMVKRNTRDMYNYTLHDFDCPDSESKFTAAITDDFSLDTTTVICTADDGNHVMPVLLRTGSAPSRPASDFPAEPVSPGSRAAETAFPPHISGRWRPHFLAPSTVSSISPGA
ncbi:hypothetical protein B0H14DRAFT_3458296 [Mycena olivaceomarginata]|nr:hypothetical protein B0H14DRAFT_3458296 [Mycena olivaceomarginata]